VLFAANFAVLADDQFLTALTWVLLLYKTRPTPGRALKSNAVLSC
jgi:hypothetical protein